VKNSNNTRDRPPLSAVPQPTAQQRNPLGSRKEEKYTHPVYCCVKHVTWL